MVRSEFYNGALKWNLILSQSSQFLLTQGSWFFCSYLFLIKQFCLIRDQFSINALLHFPLWKWIIDLTYWNSISLVVFSLFLSSFHLSTHFNFYCFTTPNQSCFSFFFYTKQISVATMIWLIYHISTGSLYPDNAKRWVGY